MQNPTNPNELKANLRRVLVENLMLQIPAEQIADDTALFGAEGLGLDSVDALQLVVALEKQFGLKIADAQAAKSTLRDINSIAAAIGAMKS